MLIFFKCNNACNTSKGGLGIFINSYAVLILRKLR